MYKFYLDGVMLPIAPESLKITMKDKDETVDLMNGGTMSILNDPGLTEFEFEVFLPSHKLPFALYDGNFRDPEYYINKLESLKTSKKPFQFVVIRWEARGLDTINNLKDTNITVSLASADVTESASDYGTGKSVAITLKQYVKYSTKKVTLSADKTTIIVDDTADRVTNPVVDTVYEVVEGDTLQSIAKQIYGKMDYWVGIADLNSIPHTVEPLTAGKLLTLNQEKIEDLTDNYDSAYTQIVTETESGDADE